jgi:hypothetical protein
MEKDHSKLGFQLQMKRNDKHFNKNKNFFQRETNIFHIENVESKKCKTHSEC